MNGYLDLKLWNDFIHWVYKDVLTWSSFFQLIAVIVLIFSSWWITRLTLKKIKIRLEGREKPHFLESFDFSLKEVIFFPYLTILLWLSMAITDAYGLKTHLLDSVTALTTAWIIVRFISGLIEHSLWSRVIAVVIWVSAALKILGILDKTTEILASYSFQVGSFSISMLTVLEGIIAFTLLFWVVHFISQHIENRFNQSTQLSKAQQILFLKITKIVLIAVAIIVGLNIIGINLTAIAIFSSAVGFGVAFGLQKVFSNLISGIILLVDKSIRPGDVIAIGDTYGEVVNLEARYVSIVTRDGKAHLIPNENMITEKVENWSYTNNLIRVKIPIGVSYNSDLRLVEKLLEAAANESSKVIDMPGPRVLLKGFGESSVDFELRVWVADPMSGLDFPKSELLFSIWDKFQENNIEIPFPQRDIHIQAENFSKPAVTKKKQSSHKKDALKA